MSEETSQPSESTETSEATQEVAMVVDSESQPEIQQETTYANGKFTSVGELEKSYGELQSTFSKKMGAFEGNPEAYEFAEGTVTEDNQALADMLGGWGMENQLSNDGINSLVGKYNEFHETQRASAMDAEFAKLGDDANARIDNARSFLEANLGKDQTEALAANMNTAGAIEAVEKLISMTKQPSVAPTEVASMVGKEALNKLRFALDEFGNRKMNDPAYRANVLKQEARLK